MRTRYYFGRKIDGHLLLIVIARAVGPWQSRSAGRCEVASLRSQRRFEAVEGFVDFEGIDREG